MRSFRIDSFRFIIPINKYIFLFSLLEREIVHRQQQTDA